MWSEELTGCEINPVLKGHALTEKLNIQTDSSHEKVDVSKSLTSHVSRKCLAVRDSFHNTVPKKLVVSKMSPNTKRQ